MSNLLDSQLTEEEKARLAAAIEMMSDQIREAILQLGGVTPHMDHMDHMAIITIKKDGQVEALIVHRDDAARHYVGFPNVDRLLARSVNTSVIPVVVSDLTQAPTTILTARIIVNVQEGGDA